MFLDILVAINSTPAANKALEQAVWLAHTSNAKLTLLTVTAPPADSLAIAGINPQTIADQLDRSAQRILRDAAASTPDDLIVHTIQRAGRPGPAICAELARHPYDLVVLGSRHRSRTKEQLLRSVNLYVHYHARTPLLSIPIADE